MCCDLVFSATERERERLQNKDNIGENTEGERETGEYKKRERER